jgi:membrane-bound lytic murein transglycosylase B
MVWNRYRKQFITPDNVQNGVNFWNQHQEALQRAYEVYGVPQKLSSESLGLRLLGPGDG